MSLIAIVEKRTTLPNGKIQCHQYQVDLSKPKVEVRKHQYEFSHQLLKSWTETSIFQKG